MTSHSLSSSPKQLDSLNSPEVFLITSLILFSITFVLSGIVVQVVSTVTRSLVEYLFRPFERSRLFYQDDTTRASKAAISRKNLLWRSLELDEECPLIAHTPHEIPKTTGNVRVVSLRSNGTPCVICLENITLGELKRTLACQHEFHARCVDKWLVGVSNSCPCCCEPVLKNTSPGAYNDVDPVNAVYPVMDQALLEPGQLMETNDGILHYHQQALYMV